MWIFVLDQDLTQVRFNEAPDAFVAGGVEFRDVGLGGFTGFLDWLRASPSVVIGFRFTPFGESERVIGGLPGRSYIERGLGDSIEVFFGLSREVDRSLSDDQAFGENRIYESEGSSRIVAIATPDPPS